MTLPYVPDTDPQYAGNRPGDGPLRISGVSISGLPSTEDNLPSTVSPCAAKQASVVAMIRDMWGGTERIRAASTKYLPKAPGEQADDYRDRLNRSVFFNAFRSAIEGLTGFVFRKDPILGDDVPAVIGGEMGHWENIDNAGTHGDVFIRDLLQDDLSTGHCGIFVEYPKTDGTQTRADETGPDSLRPYWIKIPKDNILSWRLANIGGRNVLTQIVWKECTYVPQGAFGEKEQTRYRVLFRNDAGQVGFQLLEITENRTVVEVDAGLYPTQTEIPFAEVTTSGRKAMLESAPPLADLAYLNISHYQQDSDYKTSQYKTCVPVLTISGMPNVDENGAPLQMTVGPNTVLVLPPADAKAYYAAHDGAALSSVRQALEDIKTEMGVLGLAMLAPDKRAAQTAEAKRIDKSAADSKLGVTARGLQDGVERALQFHARYLRLPDGGSITVNRDFDDMAMQADMMTAWAQLATALNLPVKVVLQALQDGGRIGPDVNIDELAQETQDNAAAQADAQQAAAADRLVTAAAMAGRPNPMPNGMTNKAA